jgi:hypothetical protein
MIRTRRTTGAVLLSAALLTGAGSISAGPAEEGPPRAGLSGEALARAKKAVNDQLAKLKGSAARARLVRDEVLARTLPGHAFFAVRFPAATVPPAGLTPSSVFAYSPERRVHVLTTMKQLERYFKDRLPPAREDERLKDAARAWLRVSQELYQDGFYKFVLRDEATKVLNRPGGSKIAHGRLAVMAGGTGMIDARLIFNVKGQLTGVSEDSKLTPGPREE